MRFQSLNKQKILILGILIGIFLSGTIALIYSVSLTDKQNRSFQVLNNHGESLVQPTTIICSTPFLGSLNKNININTATIEELDSLPGIGEVKAESIVEFRQKYGNFKTIEEILYVSGISEKTFQEICNFITTSHP